MINIYEILGNMRLNLSKKKIIALVVILIVLVVVFAKKSAKAHDAVLGGEVLLNKSDVLFAKQESINDVINFTGDLSPKEQTVISAEVDARITKIWVDEGQLVTAGQTLADLDTLDLAQAVSQQQAQLSAAKSRLDLDKQKMDKQSELLKQGFVSQIAYDELVSNYQSSLENYKAQQAILKRSQKQLSNTHIVAPFSGIVYQRNVEQGQLALKNTKLFALANLDKLEIKAAIPSDQINKIKLGQQVEFKVETDNHSYSGQVMRINQVSEPGTRSYMVYIDFANSLHNLKAGQFVKGQIILQTMANQVVVNCDAIRKDDSANSYVLLLQNNKVVSQKTSTVLMNRETGLCAVTNINAGEKILAGNVLTVKNGDNAKLVD